MFHCSSLERFGLQSGLKEKGELVRNKRAAVQEKLRRSCIRPDGESQRLQDMVMLVLFPGTVSGCGKGCGRRLEGRVVGNAQSPVRTEFNDPGFFKVAVTDTQQIVDFTTSGGAPLSSGAEQ